MSENRQTYYFRNMTTLMDRDERYSIRDKTAQDHQYGCLTSHPSTTHSLSRLKPQIRKVFMRVKLTIRWNETGYVPRCHGNKTFHPTRTSCHVLLVQQPIIITVSKGRKCKLKAYLQAYIELGR